MSDQGRLFAISDKTLGASLAVDHAIGAIDLLLDDAYVFEETGGELAIILEDKTQTLHTYSSADDDASILHLTAPTTLALDAGTRVAPWPLIVEKIGTVILGEGDPLPVLVPPELGSHPLLAEAVIPEPGLAVIVKDDPRGAHPLVLESITGYAPGVTSESLTGPAPDGWGAHVPVAPSSSPLPAADGFAGLVLLRWLGVINDTIVTYEVHAAASNGTAPSALTLVDGVQSSAYSARTLADGTPFAYDTDYYFAIWAKSDDQYAPAPSAWVMQRMDKTRNSDLAANAIDGMTITGAVVRTAAAGLRTQMDPIGLRTFNSAGVETARLEAQEGGLFVTGVSAGVGANRVTIGDAGVSLQTDKALLLSEFRTAADGPLAIGSTGNFFLAASGTSTLYSYADSGKLITSWPIGNSNAGVTVPLSGDVYVADRVAKQVVRYSASGVVQSTWSTTGTPGGIGWSWAGDIYVLDTTNSLVRVFDYTGAPITTWAAVSGTSSMAVVDDVVYIGLTIGGVLKYDLTGVSDGSFSTDGAPIAIGADSDSNIFITTAGSDVRKYTSTGTLLATWDAAGICFGLVVDAADTIWVSDSTSSSVKQFHNPGVVIESAKLDTATGVLTAVSADIGHIAGKAGQEIVDIKSWIRAGGSTVGGLWGRTADVSIANNSRTAMGGYSLFSGHPDIENYVYGTGIWTIAVAGYYRIVFKTKFAANSSGFRYFYLYENGVMVDNATAGPGHAAQYTLIYEVPYQYYDAGTTIQGRVMQNSGGTLALQGDSSGYLTSTVFEYKGSEFML